MSNTFHSSQLKNLRNWSAPVSGNVTITSGWGGSRGYRKGTHQGVDIRARVGTPIYAIGDGKVIKVVNNWVPGRGNAGGNYISIRHPGGIISEYMHLSKVDVKQGDRITGGSYIGKSGQTGGRRTFNAKASPMASHLHFQVKLTQDGHMAKVQPYKFIKPPYNLSSSFERKVMQKGTYIPGIWGTEISRSRPNSPSLSSYKSSAPQSFRLPVHRPNPMPRRSIEPFKPSMVHNNSPRQIARRSDRPNTIHRPSTQVRKLDPRTGSYQLGKIDFKTGRPHSMSNGFDKSGFSRRPYSATARLNTPPMNSLRSMSRGLDRPAPARSRRG